MERKRCCGQTASNVANASPPPENARSFRVNGLDCAEEVAILNSVVGPEVGGEEHLAFDILNGRMTLLNSGKAITNARIIRDRQFHWNERQALGRENGVSRSGSSLCASESCLRA